MRTEDEIKELDQMVNNRDSLIREINKHIRLDGFVLSQLAPEQARLLKHILED